MPITLHDLAGADPDPRFSPYCWRVKFALAHKGLSATTIPWRFTEKAEIAASGQGTVPVIHDGAHVVGDSWAIAEYLETTYPGAPLFGSDSRARLTARLSMGTSLAIPLIVSEAREDCYS